ncbi:MAG TPA: hypothetical protein VEX43_08625 [Chthoniobacterales bacterium]|nr:hypothetical protein [Chthoniobacterales bacterium]
MTISDLKEEYYFATGTVSTVVRQMALAGIAIIWIFKVGKDESGGIPFTPAMLVPLRLFILVLVADLLQYAFKSAVWGALQHHYWNKFKDPDKLVEPSRFWNWPTNTLFWVKTALCVFAYYQLFLLVYGSLIIPPAP